MFKPLSASLGLRYFSAGRSSGKLASFVAVLAITGLAMGVALLIVVTSVMNGFDRELRHRILQVVPQLQLLHSEGVENWSVVNNRLTAVAGVTAAAPFAEVEGLLYARNNAQPVQVLGLSEQMLPEGLAQMLQRQSLDIPQGNQLLLSRSLARRLAVDVGRRLNLIVSNQRGGSSATSFVVAGLFSTHTEMDRMLAIADLDQIASIAGIAGRVGGFRVQLEDQFDARNMGYKLLRQLPAGFTFRDWFQTHGNLYQAIQVSRNMVGLLIFLIVAIAAFNVVSMLMMTVVNKKADIAVLQTLGMSRQGVMRLFLVQGLLIGTVGIGLGALLGWGGCYVVVDLVAWLEQLSGVVFLNTDVYPIDYLPVDIRSADVWRIVLSALTLNILASLYPAWRASKVAPAEELRYQ